MSKKKENKEVIDKELVSERCISDEGVSSKSKVTKSKKLKKLKNEVGGLPIISKSVYNYEKNWIKDGMEVAHKEQIDVKMIVSRLLRKTRVQKDENGNEYERSYIMGVECHYWKDGDLKVHKFHTREIVPWDVAEEGHYAISEFFAKLNGQ